MTTKPKIVHGADISHHQTQTLDLKAAMKAGLQWLYHKATEGDTMVDDHYKARRALAKKAGLPFGAYHFARPEKSDAVAEAKRFLKVAAPVPGDLRPAPGRSFPPRGRCALARRSPAIQCRPTRHMRK